MTNVVDNHPWRDSVISYTWKWRKSLHPGNRGALVIALGEIDLGIGDPHPSRRAGVEGLRGVVAHQRRHRIRRRARPTCARSHGHRSRPLPGHETDRRPPDAGGNAVQLAPGQRLGRRSPRARAGPRPYPRDARRRVRHREAAGGTPAVDDLRVRSRAGGPRRRDLQRVTSLRTAQPL